MCFIQGRNNVTNIYDAIRRHLLNKADIPVFNVSQHREIMSKVNACVGRIPRRMQNFQWRSFTSLSLLCLETGRLH